jgi:hypothetical protein
MEHRGVQFARGDGIVCVLARRASRLYATDLPVPDSV